jgi:kinesin family protein 18/19
VEYVEEWNSILLWSNMGWEDLYHMLGTIENPGVMVLSIKDLFLKVKQRSHDGSHSIQLSYLEVYNVTVIDLLSPGTPLLLREDKQQVLA